MKELSRFELESFKRLENSIAQTGNTCAFDGKAAAGCMKALLDVIGDMGYNPMDTADLKRGIETLFNVEIINMPDLNHSRYILTPNHVSDFDAVVLGLLHPKIRIVSKTDWVDNDRLKPLLDTHFDLYGLDRTSITSLRRLLMDSVDYFNTSDEIKHFLVFSQGTISDFNNNSVERVSSVAQKISKRTGVPVLAMFIEQVSLYQPTRIVFDAPMQLAPQEDFRKVWLEREAAMQNALLPLARRPKLTQKHANNNKPGDPFF